jgi:cyanophycinase
MISLSTFRCWSFGLLIWTAASAGFAQSGLAYKYIRAGAAEDKTTQPQAGFALMGGGTDLDEAFSWLCERAHGGDFLILRAAGTDAYNPYVQKLCKLNTVATLILPSREAAMSPFVAETIAHAEAIFIAGGDQANYIRYWMGTPVQAAVNAAIAHGVPLGGTSAGLAVMGEWAYSAEGDKPDDPNLDSKTALKDPLGSRVTLVHGFLDIPALKEVITDSHFVKRDRMGRLIVFLQQIGNGRFTPRTQDDLMFLLKSDTLNPAFIAQGLGIDEGAAVLLDVDRHATVVGHGAAYSIVKYPDLTSKPKPPYEAGPYNVQRIKPGEMFDLKSAYSKADFTIAIKNSSIISSQPDNKHY